MINCSFCGTEVDPESSSTFQRVMGWEQPREQGGANMIHLREPLQTFACSFCIDRLKQKVSPAQGTLL